MGSGDGVRGGAAMGSGRVWQDDTDSTWAFVLSTGDGLLTHSGYSSEVAAFEAMDGIRVQLDKRRPGGSGRAEELAESISRDLSKPHLITGKKSRAALDELVRLAVEAEVARGELRDFEHVEGESLPEVAAVAAESFRQARHRADSLAGEAEGLREALRQAHVWVTDAIESTGDSDDELLAEPGTLWARLIAARDAMGAALEGKS